MTATLIGATGLIGSYLLEVLLNDPYFDTIRILIRRPIEITHPKLEKKIVDFNDSDSVLVALSNSDVVFCAIGSTMKKVKGDKDAYRKIDYDIPVNLARFCKMTGCEKFIVRRKKDSTAGLGQAADRSVIEVEEFDDPIDAKNGRADAASDLRAVGREGDA